MKKIFLLVSALAFVMITNAQDDKTPYMTKSLSGDNIKEAKVETSGGSISVAGVSADMRVEVYIKSSNNKNSYTKEEIKQKLEEEYILEVSVAGGKVTAVAKPKNYKTINWQKALSISFKLYIPANANTDLATSGGSINLTNLSGTQDFRTSGGSLHMDKLSGKIKGRTSGGSIHVSDSKDEIDLHTSGGSINAENCTGNMELVTSGGSLRLNNLNGKVDARTSGGSVHADNIKADLIAHTSGGNIDLKGLRGSVDAATSGGGVHVEIVELGKYVTINNSGGNINLTMPGDKGLDLKLRGDKIHTGTLKNFSGKMEDDRVDGTINGGGILVSVRNSGRINLTLK